jgi:hypothetical protein
MWNSRKEVGAGGKAGREAQFRFSSQKKKNQKRCNMLRILVPLGCSVLLFFSFSAGCDKSFSFSSDSEAGPAIPDFVLFRSYSHFLCVGEQHSYSAHAPLLISHANASCSGWLSLFPILFRIQFLISLHFLLLRIFFPYSSFSVLYGA